MGLIDKLAVERDAAEDATLALSTKQTFRVFFIFIFSSSGIGGGTIILSFSNTYHSLPCLRRSIRDLFKDMFGLDSTIMRTPWENKEHREPKKECTGK
jgi:hypothetical protein